MEWAIVLATFANNQNFCFQNPIPLCFPVDNTSQYEPNTNDTHIFTLAEYKYFMHSYMHPLYNISPRKQLEFNAILGNYEFTSW